MVNFTAELEAADAHLLTGAYDLVLLDLTARREKMLSLLESCRQGGMTACVLALLPQTAAADGPRALDLGADDYLVRPFPWPELLARLRALLRPHPERKEGALRTHDLEIDPSERTVKRGGRFIHLSPREYNLLEILARHRGRTVSRAAIRQQLCPGEEGAASNLVDVYIRYLRVKIDKGFDPPLILTRRGHGYMLRGDEGAE